MSLSRRNVSFDCHGETIAGWVYPAKQQIIGGAPSARPGPGIVLAHGFGATKEMRLDAYADRFSSGGYTCLVFDYRCIGQSTGKPRGLINLNQQYQDWIEAIKYIRSLPSVDRNQVAIFSITFGTRNLIKIAAQDTGLKAVICQCPLFKQVLRSKTTDLRDIPKLVYLAFKDVLFGTDDHPITVPIHSVPGHASLLSKGNNFQNGYKSLMPPNILHHPNSAPARFVFWVPFMHFGSQISSVKAPIFFSICGRDTVAPPKTALQRARCAPNATIIWFENLSHWDIYHGEAFEVSTGYYLKFLSDHMCSYEKRFQ